MAACTKTGGLLAQALGIAGLAPRAGTATAIIMAPAALALLLVLRHAQETRGRDLSDVDGRDDDRSGARP